MMNAAELFFLGRYNGNQMAPVGTYWLPRTNAYQQQASDAVLPQAGTWIMLSSTSTLTTTQIANQINAALGTAYTAGSFHAYSGGSDAIAYPGTSVNDA